MTEGKTLMKEHLKSIEIEVEKEYFTLFSQRGLLWGAHKLLLIADLHLGKVNHFRRAGIPVPPKANEKNIESLVELIQMSSPQRVVFLGDLFHSHYNEEWEVFGELVKHFNHINFELVLGNHDIMSDVQYNRKGIAVVPELVIGPFRFTHHPEETRDYYNIAGHIHPGVSLRGKGRQQMTLPCFYFGKKQGYLPAFGIFTGLSRIRPQKDDRIFAIVEDQLIQVE